MRDIRVWMAAAIVLGCGGTAASIQGSANGLGRRHAAGLAELGTRELGCPEGQLNLSFLEHVSDRNAIYRVQGCGKKLDALYWLERAWVPMPDREAEFALGCPSWQVQRRRISENTFGYDGCGSRIIYRLDVGMQLTFVRDSVAPAERPASGLPPAPVPGPAQPPP